MVLLFSTTECAACKIVYLGGLPDLHGLMILRLEHDRFTFPHRVHVVVYLRSWYWISLTPTLTLLMILHARFYAT